MTRFVVNRIIQGLISLAIITVVIFALTSLLGDPVAQLLPPNYTQNEYDQLSAALGYDDPVIVQFGNFVSGLLRGDLGESSSTSRPVLDVLMARLPVTGMLALASVVLGYSAAVLVGFLAGFSRSRPLEVFTTILASLGTAMPAFAVGIILIVVFAVKLQLVPAGGWGSLSQVVLPIATLSIWMFASTVRVARSTMQERSSEQFVTLARTKGLGANRTFFRHAFRPSLPPVISYAAVLAGTLFSGAVVTETLFGIPGIGALAAQAVRDRDQPLVIGVVMLSSLIFILLNMSSDVLAAVLDPRVRLQGALDE